MPVLQVTQTTDFSTETLIGPITAVEFDLAPEDGATATFSGAQADGDPLILSLEVIGSAGRDAIRVIGATIDASGWDFTNWTDIDSGTFELIDTVTLEGTAGADTIKGTGDVMDTLLGHAGNDTLHDKRSAQDPGDNSYSFMAGGAGNDTYFVGKLGGDDQILELAGEGVDNIGSSVSFILPANVENLDLLGSAELDGTGNTLDNIVLGNHGDNRLIGLAGADTIRGDAGHDTLNGGTGDDEYSVDSLLDIVTEFAGQGVDKVVSWVTIGLAANVENLELIGNAEDAIGNALANHIQGNSYNSNRLFGLGGSDFLDGEGGNDTMTGGAGNDIMVVHGERDVVSELAGEGTDSVRASVSYTLGANVENLSLTSLGSTNGTGNGLANIIDGNAFANVLRGNGGNDRLNGQLGNDSMHGGLGNDIMWVGNAGDVVTELAGEGIDTIKSSISLTLASNVEKLQLTGAADINGTGNTLANVIEGNGGSNILSGGLGQDFLTGGGAADIFDYNANSESGTATAARDIVADFAHLTDKLDLSSIDAKTATALTNDAFSFIGGHRFSAEGQISVTQSGHSAIVWINTTGGGGAEMAIQLSATTASTLTAADFVL